MKNNIRYTQYYTNNSLKYVRHIESPVCEIPHTKSTLCKGKKKKV